MSSGDSLPQVLVNPKLHRRQGNEVSFSKLNNCTQENKKCVCPPIDALKDKVSTDVISFSSSQEKSYAGLQHTHTDPSSADPAVSPLSPANGLSPACAAMANACSHDHDYLSPDLHRSNRDGTRHMTELSLNIDCSENGIILPRHDATATVRVPVPPKTITQKSPRDGKLMRDITLRHHRRILKPSAEILDANAKQQDPPTSNESACVFVSSSKTARPRARSRTTRRKVRDADENLNQRQTSSSSSSKRSTSTISDNFSNDNSGSVKDIDFDVTKDKLTVEWQNMVKQYHSKQEHSLYSSDDLSEDDLGHPVDHSTPGKAQCNIPSPQPSVTPCPPASRRLARCGFENHPNHKLSEKDELSNSNVGKTDSAYFSFNSSVSSSQPRSCAGTPIVKSVPLDNSRPSTGQRSAGSTRPPSGGKRIADASLSSTSSGSSSDDDSLRSSTSSKIIEEEDAHKQVVKANDGKTRNSSVESLTPATNGLQKEHRVVRLRKGKKVIVKPHMRPVPPRKPKDPLPMNRRALPTSFFKEPNRFSPSPYNILPPVLPLFPQPLNDDINDIRPVTPPEQQPPEDRKFTYAEKNKQVVIKIGDTDLLHRLFDTVDPQPHRKGQRIRRGRPKRPPKILPSPKLTLDNNPCIMQSITEKLFPNLSIEKRHIKQRHFQNQAVAGMMLSSDKNLVDDTAGVSFSIGDSTDFDNRDKDLSQFGLLSFSSSSYEEEVTDNRMEIASPAPQAQRHEVLALPQLPLAQDYSQMLSDVAAVL